MLNAISVMLDHRARLASGPGWLIGCLRLSMMMRHIDQHKINQFRCGKLYVLAQVSVKQQEWCALMSSPQFKFMWKCRYNYFSNGELFYQIKRCITEGTESMLKLALRDLRDLANLVLKKRGSENYFNRICFFLALCCHFLENCN